MNIFPVSSVDLCHPSVCCYIRYRTSSLLYQKYQRAYRYLLQISFIFTILKADRSDLSCAKDTRRREMFKGGGPT